MNYELIIVRYGEIALKGKETRKRFENTLVSNIKNALDKNNLSCKIAKEWGRIYIRTEEINECISVLQKIFGLTSVSPAIQTTSDMDSVSKLAVDISKAELNTGKSFAIRANRTGEQPYTSQDVAVNVGNDVVKATNANVDLGNPDFELFIEIRNDKAFLFKEKIRCVGGMPLGSQGKILALIDKPESILAAWYLIRRGCKPIFITTEKSNNLLDVFIEKWYLKSEIFTNISKNNLSKIIKESSIKNGCDALVTGYIINNNSKTLYGISQLKRQIDIPVLTPLIAMDQDEIMKKSKEIGLSV